MRPFIVRPVAAIKGQVSPAGDKSITHRCIIASALSPAKTIIKNFPFNQDCLSTVSVFRKLGIKIIPGLSCITVFGQGLYGLSRPKGAICVGDSGTTLRLALGVLAGQGFTTRLTAGRSLARRPMRRVNLPLRMMGAQIKSKIPACPAGRKNKKSKIKEEYAPITIKGGKLQPITYKMPVASAQVKSAILLAGLYAEGVTRVIEPVKSRDHTERILKLFKAGIKVNKNKIFIRGGKELTSPKELYLPGDISSASFFMVLAAIMPEAKILIKNISLNPSRTGIIRVLRRMGANIRVTRIKNQESRIEPCGNLMVKSSRLEGTVIRKKEIPSLIDELPILMVAACCAKGKTIFAGVEELHLKETDRIKSMSDNLKKMGAKIRIFKTAKSEKIIIEGVKELKGAGIKSFGDHRTAMSMVIAALGAAGETRIDDVSCINKSFPDFLRVLHRLRK